MSFGMRSSCSNPSSTVSFAVDCGSTVNSAGNLISVRSKAFRTAQNRKEAPLRMFRKYVARRSAKRETLPADSFKLQRSGMCSFAQHPVRTAAQPQLFSVCRQVSMHTVEYFKGNSMSTVTVSCTLSSSVRHSKRLYPNPCDTTQLLPNAAKG